MGCVDELWIDLLYQTGEGYRDYVQLSDLVASGEADAEQREAFALLGQVAERVKDSERLDSTLKDLAAARSSPR